MELKTEVLNHLFQEVVEKVDKINSENYKEYLKGMLEFYYTKPTSQPLQIVRENYKNITTDRRIVVDYLKGEEQEHFCRGSLTLDIITIAEKYNTLEELRTNLLDDLRPLLPVYTVRLRWGVATFPQQNWDDLTEEEKSSTQEWEYPQTNS